MTYWQKEKTMFKLLIIVTVPYGISVVDVYWPTIDHDYSTIEECAKAGEISKENYIGGRTFEWACVPSSRALKHMNGASVLAKQEAKE